MPRRPGYQWSQRALWIAFLGGLCGYLIGGCIVTREIVFPPPSKTQLRERNTKLNQRQEMLDARETLIAEERRNWDRELRDARAQQDARRAQSEDELAQKRADQEAALARQRAELEQRVAVLEALRESIQGETEQETGARLTRLAEESQQQANLIASLQSELESRTAAALEESAKLESARAERQRARPSAGTKPRRRLLMLRFPN